MTEGELFHVGRSHCEQRMTVVLMTYLQRLSMQIDGGENGIDVDVDGARVEESGEGRGIEQPAVVGAQPDATLAVHPHGVDARGQRRAVGQV